MTAGSLCGDVSEESAALWCSARWYVMACNCSRPGSGRGCRGTVAKRRALRVVVMSCRYGPQRPRILASYVVVL